MDLGFIGPRYTWSKHFVDGQLIWERLDRGLATNSWFLKFPSLGVTISIVIHRIIVPYSLIYWV